MASLKRKHVNLTDQGHPSPPAGPTVHPDRVGSTQKLSARAEVEAAKVTLTSISTQPSLTVNAIQKAKKSVVKQRYLVKKAKKRRKIVAARKASAPKNKQWKADGDVENEELTSASGIRSNKGGQVDDDVQKEAKEDRLDAAKVDVEAGPSRPRNDSNGDAVTKDEHSGANGTYEVNDKERRKQEKREKKEEKESVDKITKKKRKHVEAIADDTEPPVFEVRASNDALITEETGQDIDEDAERERRRLEKREKRANRDKMRKTKPKEVEDDVDDVLDLRDDAFDAPKADVEVPLLSPPASPPALEAFPLPRPAPAPDPRVLAQQGLPVGLTDATFVDQDLRIRVDKLEYTRQGKLETGVSERMGKRLAEIGVEEFFAG